LKFLSSQNNSVATTGGRFANVDTDGTSVGLQLAVPIFSGGAVVSQTCEAVERH
jgi:outer membrane protein TolC